MLLGGKHVSVRIACILYTYTKIRPEKRLHVVIPRWEDDGRFSFHSLHLYTVSEWSKYQFYSHGNSNNKAVSILKQGRGKIFHRSSSVTLVCFSVAGSQRLYLLVKCPPSVKSLLSSVPTAVKHFIFPATVLLSAPRSLAYANTCLHSLRRQGLIDSLCRQRTFHGIRRIETE